MLQGILGLLISGVEIKVPSLPNETFCWRGRHIQLFPGSKSQSFLQISLEIGPNYSIRSDSILESFVITLLPSGPVDESREQVLNGIEQ